LFNRKQQKEKARYFYFSSGFTPDALKRLNYSSKQLLTEVAPYLELGKHGELFISPKRLNDLFAQTQYAVMYQHWLLASYPVKNRKRILVLVNLKTGRWTVDRQTQLAKQAPFVTLLKKLNQHFSLHAAVGKCSV